MLRVECSCGNVWKVSDDKAGKKVKCPECDELVLAKRASAVSTKPMPAARGDEDEDDVDEIEDIDDIDDQALPKKKGGAGCLLAILGVVLLGGMVVLIGGGAAAYFLWFNKGSEAPVASSGPVAVADNPVNQENFAIRLQQPRKVGDVREVLLKSEQTTIGMPDGALPSIELHCKIKTLSVESPLGQETGWEMTIKRLTVTNGMPGATTPLPEGTVVVGKLIAGPVKHISWQIKGTNTPVIGQTMQVLGQACGRQLVSAAVQAAYVDDDDALLGTADKQTVGSTWNVNTAPLNKTMNAGLPGTMVEVTSALGKLNSVTAGIADVDITIDATVDSKKAGAPQQAEMVGTMQAKLGYQFPIDNSQGPTRVTCKQEAKLSVSAKGVMANVNHSEAVTLEIKYLPNEPIVAAKETKPLAIKLSNATAKWVPGAKNAADVAVSADYSVLSGDAKGTCNYMLFLVYNAASGKKEYLVGSLPGTQLAFAPQGTLGGTVKGIEGPLPAPNQLAELVLKEAPLKDATKTTNLFTLPSVVISGSPSTATPTTAKVQIELSGAKVERTGKSFNLNAQYKVVGGKLDTQANYRWEVELAGSKIPKGAKDTLTTQPGGKMDTKGALSKTMDFTQDFGAGVTYTMRMVEEKGNVSTVVSSRDVSGEVTGSGEAPMPGVKLAATINAAVNAKGIMTVQWKLNGPPDPNANYQFFYELKGGKGKNTGFLAPATMQQPMSGKQFQQEGTFSFPVLVQGQNQFEVILLEFTQADPKGRRIGSYSGK
jgi:hypothetical protein